jgi:anti-sigma28 factor (negative regulator of flagellin synthesis)
MLTHMIVNKQQQRVTVLEHSTLTPVQEHNEVSSPDTQSDIPVATEKKLEDAKDLYALSPKYNEQLRAAYIEQIKTQIARKQYRVDSLKLARAILHPPA